MEEKILNAMAKNGAMKAGEVATAIGEDKDAVAKAIKKLTTEGKLYSPKRCYYDVQK